MDSRIFVEPEKLETHSSRRAALTADGTKMTNADALVAASYVLAMYCNSRRPGRRRGRDCGRRHGGRNRSRSRRRSGGGVMVVPKHEKNESPIHTETCIAPPRYNLSVIGLGTSSSESCLTSCDVEKADRRVRFPDTIQKLFPQGTGRGTKEK